MSLLLLPVGLLFPTVAGWLALSLLEWNTRVLGRTERWVLGSLLGLTLTMWLMFLANVVFAAPLTRVGFLSMEIAITLALSIPWYLTRTKRVAAHVLPGAPSHVTLWQKAAMAAMGLWLLVKILPLAFTLVTTPPYLDDTLNNWNQRAKVFVYAQRVELRLMTQKPTDEPSSLSAYPPTVPLAKASLSAIKGSWDEGLSNSIHALWLVTTLALLYFALRRYASAFWSLFGVYVLASLPLYVIHGTNAYADVFVSAHVFAAVSLLFHAAMTTHEGERRSYLRLFGLAVSLLPMTKNEGLVLYLPAILGVALLFFLWEAWKKKRNRKHLLNDGAWIIAPVLVVALSWIVFKWIHHMPFGNAKSLTGLTLGWQPNVLYSIFINTFFEANWLLFFPLLLALIVIAWKRALRTPLLVLTGFLLVAYGMQLPLYLFTSLSNEALYQTGYARGLIHIVPIATLLATLLLHNIFSRERIDN